MENVFECGDCVKKMKDIEKGSVDLLFVDPPWNINYKYDIYEDNKSVDEYLQWTRSWGEAALSLLKPNGTFWLAIGDEFAADLKVLFQREFRLSCRSWVIWYYTFGVNCGKKFSRSHTHLLQFVVNPDQFTFNVDAISVPSARQRIYKDKRANPKGRLPDDTWILRPQELTDGFDPVDDTWHVPRVCGTFKERAKFHGCQMPELVLERIIKVSTNVGDIVLDPMAGTGTTLAVAKRLDRKYIGFELSETYHNLALKRLDAIVAVSSLPVEKVITLFD